MKIFILALLLMLPIYAKADASATFVRIECNKELEFLDIYYQDIYGDKIVSYFQDMKEVSFFYKTSEKTSTEIQFQNPSALIELRDSVPISKLNSSDYKYTCKLNTNQEYEITLSLNPYNTCQQNVGYNVSIVQNLYTPQTMLSKEILKDIAIGCAEKYKRITITSLSEYDADITLKNYNTKGYFPNFETNKTINNKLLEQKYIEMTTFTEASEDD